ncbi:hypothetical protein MRX96_011587 [Rhipicephalus microplus]
MDVRWLSSVSEKIEDRTVHATHSMSSVSARFAAVSTVHAHISRWRACTAVVFVTQRSDPAPEVAAAVHQSRRHQGTSGSAHQLRGNLASLLAAGSENVARRFAHHGGDDDGPAETSFGKHHVDTNVDVASGDLDRAAGVPHAAADSGDARDGSRQPRESLSTRPATRGCAPRTFVLVARVSTAKEWPVLRFCVCPCVPHASVAISPAGEMDQFRDGARCENVLQVVLLCVASESTACLETSK